MTYLLAFTHMVADVLPPASPRPYCAQPSGHTKPSISDSTYALTFLPPQIPPALYCNPSPADP